MSEIFEFHLTERIWLCAVDCAHAMQILCLSTKLLMLLLVLNVYASSYKKKLTKLKHNWKILETIHWTNQKHTLTEMNWKIEPKKKN